VLVAGRYCGTVSVEEPIPADSRNPIDTTKTSNGKQETLSQIYRSPVLSCLKLREPSTLDSLSGYLSYAKSPNAVLYVPVICTVFLEIFLTSCGNPLASAHTKSHSAIGKSTSTVHISTKVRLVAFACAAA